MTTHKSFASLAGEINRMDAAAAERLRRSRPLAKGRKPGNGPRKAHTLMTKAGR